MGANRGNNMHKENLTPIEAIISMTSGDNNDILQKLKK